MDHLDKENLKRLKSKRRKVNRKMEEERHELLNQLESLIGNWKGPLTDLRPFLRREEIDELLIRIVKRGFHFAKTYAHVIESVIKTGYRDEPEVNKNGKPLLRRTTAVHWLTGQNKNFFIGMLLKIYNRFDVNYVSKWGRTHFHMACQCGRDDVVRKFLELGQDPNCLAQDTVDPPLHLALKHKHKKVVELLLRSGADANLINKDGLTPLHVICKSVGYYDNKLAELFFEINDELHQPVEVNVRDKWGRTPLQLAVANLMPDAVDTLLVNGADLTDFIFPSDLAKRYPLDCEIQIIVFRTTSIVESLESRGYELDRTAALTIMKVFATYGLIDDSTEEFDWLLVQDAYNGTHTSEVPFIDFVIRSGYKDKPDLDKDGKPLLRRTTAVHRASRSFRPKICSAIPKLFEIYDDANYIDDLGFTHFHVACEMGCEDVVQKFLELKQDPNCLAQKSVDPPLHLALKYDEKEVVELLLRGGADANLANKDGLTPLHVMCKVGVSEELFFKINDELKKPVQVNARDKFGRTPLHFALSHFRASAAKLLLKKGADPNLASNDGSTALHVICKIQSDGDLATILFNTAVGEIQKVKVDAADKLGRTPLQWAVANLLSNVVDVLLDHNADLSSFVFPTEDYFAKRYKLGCTLQKIVFRMMSIVKSLENKGYNLDQTAALMIMKLFAKHGLIDELVDIDECLHSDEDFMSIAKEQMVSPSLTLYDFLRLPHEEAENVLKLENYEEFTSEISHLFDESHRVYIKHLCETVARRFFRRWALELFSKKSPWLSKNHCEKIINPMKIKDLWDISMAAANENTQWLDSVRTDYVKNNCGFVRVRKDMSTSDLESDPSLVRAGSECDPEDVDHVDKTNVEKLISLRESINWEIEEERHKLLDQLYRLIRNWEGQLPDLSEIFRPEELDWLLVQDAYNKTYISEVPQLIDFVIRTGYKYKPGLDKDGKPLLHRTTAVHRATRSFSSMICNEIPMLFEIYDYANYIDDLGFTHFHVACENDCDQVVKKFLELGQDPNCLAQKSVDPPLHLALKYGQKRVVEFLLRGGADANLANKDGLTPLHVICKIGVFQELFFKINDELKKPVQVNAQDKLRQTPLHLALLHGRGKLVKTLLLRGASPNLVSIDGSSALHVICKIQNDGDLAKKFFDICDDIPVEVDAADKLGRTPLQWAAASLLSDVVDVLLNHGANLSSFVFPTEDYFAKRYKLDCTLQKVVFRTMSIIKSLENKGYELDQTTALMIMKLFAKHGLIDDSVNVDECLRSDEYFMSIAKEQMVNPCLTLYDFLQLPPVKAEKVFTMKDYDQYTSEIYDLCDDSHRAFTTYLCETVTYGFFRRWAVKLFSKKTPWLSKHYCEILMGHLNIKGLWDICMEAANEKTEWLDSVRTDYVKKYYNRNLSLSYSSDDCYKS
ncbi:unnamed protein product [Trichogramma brassicae]|uniref:Uncharacterized protein n=1 Tax=Trichogramma brassicae TaxID=86971 RepID=A0A6H5I1X5_9HYME|nr:unnamed protein product [Trichogramma brassicae]